MSQMKSWKRWLVAGVAATTMAAGTAAVWSGVASAQSGGGWLGPGRPGQDEMLAGELGVSVDRLQAAREATRTRAMDQSLAEGRVSQEQYAQMQVHAALADYLDRDAMAASALGITVDELAQQSLAAWLDELGLDRETFHERMEAARAEAAAQAVADGVITQAEADAMPAGGARAMLGGRGRMTGGPGAMNGLGTGGDQRLGAMGRFGVGTDS